MALRELLAPTKKKIDLKAGLVVPVLLSGGAGTRLWPLSRETYPKQLLSLIGEHTLLQQAAMRVADRNKFTAPLVVAHEEHRFVIAEQLRSLGIADSTIVLEPVRRNTAAAVAVAALMVNKIDPNTILLVMPVDHLIRDDAAFIETINTAAAAAEHHKLSLFGIHPTQPATGYGYISVGAPMEAAPGVHEVGEFIEKPDAARAAELLASGDYLWNSGIFLLPVRTLLRELERHAPEVLKAARNAVATASLDLDFLRLREEPLAACPSISLDKAVLEKTDRAVVVPARFDWSDIGSWSTLWEVGDKTAAHNVEIGDVIAEDSRGCYLRGDGPLVAALGVDDLVVVATPDVVLVTPKNNAQDVGRLVSRLKQDGHRSATQTQCVYRPWGYYQQIHVGERFQVKRITVNPGCKLSLQKHFHRAEHWVVVNGTALVTRDDEQVLLGENESLFIPLGAMHRLENPGKMPLNLIEVQSGAYLGEDDIVRVEDIYNRVTPELAKTGT
ncbi:MAG: mannose-1-phosphate guanylyltransferase/mannose-6-phosphate isomerase [Pseudolabrys sp.]